VVISSIDTPLTAGARHAFEHGVSFNELLKTSIEQYLDQSEHPQARDERIA
jgi:hypothetical protein